MGNKLSRIFLCSFLLAGISALVALWRVLSIPSDPNYQVLFGLSINRLAMISVLLAAALLSLVMGMFTRSRTGSLVRLFLNVQAHRIWAWFFFAFLLIIVIAGLWVSFSPSRLPISSATYLRLQPGLLWIELASALALINLLILLFLRPAPGLELEIGTLNASQPRETEPLSQEDIFFQDFLIGGGILFLCIVFLFLENLAIGFFVKNSIDPGVLSSIRTAYQPEFHPEQLERARYLASLLSFPVLCVCFWFLFGKLPVRSILRSRSLNMLAYVAITLIVVFFALFALRRNGFFYLYVLFPDHNLSFAVGGFFIFAILLFFEKRISACGWARWIMRVGEIAILITTGIIIFFSHLLFTADLNAYLNEFNMIHLNAYFYSVVQVAMGKTLLVDLVSQYGFYPYLLQPILRVTGLDFSALTAVESVLLVGFFSILFFLLSRYLKSRLIALCAFLAIVGSLLSCTFWKIPFGVYGFYFQYWPHRVIFPGLLLLSVYFYQKAGGNFKKALYYFVFIICGFGILWNMDTGFVAIITWLGFLCWETLNASSVGGWKKTIQSIVFHTAMTLLSCLIVFGMLILYTWIRSGVLPDIREIAVYQVIFYQYGFYMLPMPLIHPWNLVALLYMTGICLCMCGWIKKGLRSPPDAGPADTSRLNLVFLVSVMGLGLFSNYQGRSHDFNLLGVSWPAFILMGLFADALWDRFRQPRGFPWKKKALKFSMLLMPVSLIFVLFLYASYMLKNLPSLGGYAQSRIQIMNNAQRSIPYDFNQKIELMKKHFAPGEEAVIFSEKYQAIFYISTRTTNPVQVPSFVEIFFLTDIQKYYQYLDQNSEIKIMMSDDFSQYDPGLFDYIRRNFVEIDRVDDLGVFVKKKEN